MPTYLEKATKNILNCLVYLPFLWLGTGLCLIADGRSIMTRVMLIAIIGLLILYRKQAWSYRQKSKQQLYTSLSLIFLIIYLAISQFYHSADEGLIRTLGLIVIYFYLFPVNKLNPKWLITSIIINAIWVSYIIYNNEYVSNVNRLTSGHGMSNPIPFATHSLLILITQVYYLLKSRVLMLRLTLATAALVSVFSIFLTDSRGVILALLLTFLAFLVKILLTKNKKIAYISLSATILICSLLTIFISNDIHHRYIQTQSEIQTISKGSLDTSIGFRLQMWKSAMDTFQKNPMFGIGDDNIHNEFARQFPEGLLTKSFMVLNPIHYHNQFVDIVVRYGLIGLILLALPFITFIKLCNNNRNNLSLLYIFSLAICGLTDVPLFHLSLVFLFFLLFLFSSEKGHTEKNRNKKCCELQEI